MPGFPCLQPKRKKLKSAQRFSLWLCVVELASGIMLLVEIVMIESSNAYSSPGRIFFAISGRSTMLFLVAILSYLNVVRGRPVLLGRTDYIVWLPTVILLGAGLAAVIVSSEQSDHAVTWVFTLAWLSVIALSVTLAFGRLLFAVIRVRRETLLREEPVMIENERDSVYLPPLAVEAGISTTFLRPQTPITATSSDGFMPSRTSQSSNRSLAFLNTDPYPGTPTPGAQASRRSISFDLDRALMSPRFSASVAHLSQYEDTPRPSMQSYWSSSADGAARYLGAGRLASVPHTGLSRLECQKALIMIGGHITAVFVGYILVLPFLAGQIKRPDTQASLIVSVFVILSVCLPAILLAVQTALCNGFWFKRSKPIQLTSSTAALLEKGVISLSPSPVPTDAMSRTVTPDPTFSRAPGIPLNTADCDGKKMGRFSRMLAASLPHPRLMLLPDPPTKQEEVANRHLFDIDFSLSRRGRSMSFGNTWRSGQTGMSDDSQVLPDSNRHRKVNSDPGRMDHPFKVNPHIKSGTVPTVTTCRLPGSNRKEAAINSHGATLEGSNMARATAIQVSDLGALPNERSLRRRSKPIQILPDASATSMASSRRKTHSRHTQSLNMEHIAATLLSASAKEKGNDTEHLGKDDYIVLEQKQRKHPLDMEQIAVNLLAAKQATSPQVTSLSSDETVYLEEEDLLCGPMPTPVSSPAKSARHQEDKNGEQDTIEELEDRVYTPSPSPIPERSERQLLPVDEEERDTNVSIAAHSEEDPPMVKIVPLRTPSRMRAEGNLTASRSSNESLRPQRSSADSVTSHVSSNRTSFDSVTSEGFANMLQRGSWASSVSSSDVDSDVESRRGVLRPLRLSTTRQNMSRSKRDSQTCQVYINVPSPTPSPAQLADKDIAKKGAKSSSDSKTSFSAMSMDENEPLKTPTRIPLRRSQRLAGGPGKSITFMR